MLKRFNYTARSLDGRRISGQINAFSREAATDLLQEAGVYVISVVPSRVARHPYLRRIYIPETERIFFLECWAMLLEAGLSMQTALLRLKMNTRLPSLAYAIDRMQQAIDEGAPVTEALKISRLFPPSWIAVLSAGEQVGDFVDPLKKLHRHAVEFRRLKRRLYSMLLMPSVLVVLVGVWLYLFISRVIPSLSLLVSSAGASSKLLELFATTPVPTIAAIAWVFVALLLFVALYRLETPADQEMGMLLSWIPPAFPLIGSLISRMHLVVIAKGLQLQVEAGIPLTKAIESIGHGVGNPAVRGDLLQAYRKLQEGIPVPEALNHIRVIPEMGKALIVAGDASGKLPEMLDFLARETQSILVEQVKRMTILLRTFVILITGVLVGLLVVAFFYILYSSISSLAQSLGSSSSTSLSPPHAGG